jgi:hypothetical protein
VLKAVLKALTPPVLWQAASSVRSRLSPQAPPAEPLPTSGERIFRCHGLTWRLDLSSIIARTMIAAGTWEPDTTRLVRDYVRPGMHVLSVGANFGYYALLMAQQVGPSGHVWAFEPTRLWRERLLWHVRENGFTDRVTVLPSGLSDEERDVAIDLTPQSASMHY